MGPLTLSIAALLCFAIGGVLAAVAIVRENLRGAGLQLLFVLTGLLLQTGAIGLNCVERDTHFFNSNAEIFGLLAWALAFSYVIALAASAVRLLGVLILPLVVGCLSFSLLSDQSTVDPGLLKPGAVFAVHIICAFLGYGLFLTACGAGVLYLEQSRQLKRKAFGVLFQNLPSLERLERVAVTCTWLGFAFFTVAIGTGAMLQKELKLSFWLDSKVLAAQLTWLVFGAVIVARSVRWLHGRALAKFLLAGAALVLITFAMRHPFGRPAVAPETAKVSEVRL